tara:strand:+ start:710 stop:913 length:204 start_codon:yes stop_codon:yes gene_type:complete
MKTEKDQIYQWLSTLPIGSLNHVIRLAHKARAKKTKQKKKEAVYAAQENAWFNNETDHFPAPLDDKN